MTRGHEPVAFAVPKRYNSGLDPAFLNNTEARITAAPSRPGPVVEICT